MATLYTHQDSNIRKTWVLMTAFFIVVIGLGWVFSFVFEDQVILFIAVFLAVFMNIFAYWNSHKLVIWTSGAKEAPEKEFQELHNIVENLAITAGLPKPKVYIISDGAPNAFATGRDPKHAVVAVTTGILRLLSRTELEGVLAHELSHVGNRDMLVSTIVVVLVGFVTLLSDFFLRMTIHGGIKSDNRGGGNLQLIMIVVGFALMILAPLIAQLMHFAISRKREFLADASGALLTRYPEGLASALEKIGSYPRPMARANHAIAHLFISNPFGGGKTSGFITKIFSTHPPIEERVRVLRGQ